ncbi:MAG: 4-(cytidine 5'-diphospho)-2-C-methyl-D-erythritol kinase [Alphaproteobacteria bacterium]|nr:4-(cytidine 5'-diphospho)-2-C-methyl-D-erythritol kinase [Alphaproteobacteria bacterium]
MLRVSAPAKINLSLKIIGRRDDGYHLLESLVAFADIGDRLFISKSETSSLQLSGPFAAALGEANIIAQAHVRLASHVGQALHSQIILEKNLPVAAGIGGGSADAAAALRGLAQLHNVDVPLTEIAASLGADVPVCLDTTPAWMSGIGHNIERLPDLPPADIVLVNPRVALSTADVFAAFAAKGEFSKPTNAPEGFASSTGLLDFMRAQGNDLQAAACSLAPEIEDCLAALRKAGLAYVAMSGSGATCFGLSAPGSGRAMAARYRTMREKDWVVAGRLIGAGDTKINETD